MQMPIPPLAPPPALQRARGRAEVTVAAKAGRSVLSRLFQQGCAKAILPRAHGGTPEAVLVNTSGGVTGGDHLAFAMRAEAGASFTVTTQAAERIYRAGDGGPGRIETRIEIGAGGRIDWLPQETILFEGSRLLRHLDADLAPDAVLTALETVVLGRAAMGEVLSDAHFSDQWRLRRAGRLVHAEALRIDAATLEGRHARATLGGHRALATLVHLAPGAETRIEATRALLAAIRAEIPSVEAAATAREGLLILRLLAPDAAPLRAALIRLLIPFRAGPLPRVWSL